MSNENSGCDIERLKKLHGRAFGKKEKFKLNKNTGCLSVSDDRRKVVAYKDEVRDLQPFKNMDMVTNDHVDYDFTDEIYFYPFQIFKKKKGIKTEKVKRVKIKKGFGICGDVYDIKEFNNLRTALGGIKNELYCTRGEGGLVKIEGVNKIGFIVPVKNTKEESGEIFQKTENTFSMSRERYNDLKKDYTKTELINSLKIKSAKGKKLSKDALILKFQIRIERRKRALKNADFYRRTDKAKRDWEKNR